MSLQVQHLTKRYAGRAVVQDVTFDVADGELVALLGPSGSGKSTILRIVAGLTAADSGRVQVDEADVTALPPKARDLGFVFQNYALFEHLTVADNVEFALRVRKMGRYERQQRRDELLELVGLGGSALKYPSQLSGGQRQRTALARALAHKPRLLLLDEPFGALDARIRQELRQGLRDLLRRLGTTAMFVTHDQEEAFAVADRIMVLHRGRLLEQGPPQQLYRSPQTEFVASFVGRANLLPGELTANGVRIRLDGTPARPDAVPQRVKVLLRPEKLELFADDSSSDPSSIEGGRGSDGGFTCRARVERTEYLGASERVHLLIDEGRPADQGKNARNYVLEALRPIDRAMRLPLQSGDRVSVAAKALHVVSQPNLRVLVVADADDDGCTLAEAALDFGERGHALVTLIGGVSRNPQWHARLEHYRQAFAGDLRVIDVDRHGTGLLEAARIHLQGERHDLLLLPASLREAARTLEFLRDTDIRHLLLAAREGTPLAADGAPRWSVLLRAFAAGQPDLDLIAELAGGMGAQVDVRDLAGALHGDPPSPRWYEALSLHRVPFTIGRDGDGEDDRDVAGDGAIAPLDALEIDRSADLLALDLGPRAGLGNRQQAWLRSLDDRWLLLMIQPDEADLGLRSTTVFRREAAEAALPAALHPTPQTQRTTP